jgi:hypothetical protein
MSTATAPASNSALPTPPAGVTVPTIQFFVAAAPIIRAAMPAASLPAPIGASTGPCDGAFATLLQSLMTSLTTCIPAAATPQGLADVFAALPKRIEGIGYRAMLGAKLRDFVTAQAGVDADGQAISAMTLAPLKTACINYFGGLKLADSQTILSQYESAVAAVAAVA